MKLPQQLKIGGHEIKVVLTNDQEDRLHGETNYNDNTITLNNKLSPSQIVATFYHEWLHTINTELDHEKIEYLAQAIAQLHIDNDIYFYVEKRPKSNKVGAKKRSKTR